MALGILPGDLWLHQVSTSRYALGPMPFPIFVDERGHRISTRRCWTCGAPVPVHRYSAHTLRLLTWKPGKVYPIVNHCGHGALYVVWPMPDPGWYLPVPLLDDENAHAPYAPGRSVP